MSRPSESGVRAFVLAAGLGERLRPITEHLAKPLLPVLGRPMIGIVLDRIFQAGVTRAAVNVFHLADQIEGWVRSSPHADRIALFREPVRLGTSGAFWNARDFLQAGRFIVHNSDILSDIDLAALIERHMNSGALVTLAVHDHPGLNVLRTDEAGRLLGVVPDVDASTGRPMAFTGIAVYDPGFLEFVPPGNSHVVDCWHAAVKAGRRIMTMDVTGARWRDVGTPDAYAAVVWEELALAGESFFNHGKSAGCRWVEPRGRVVIEDGACVSGPARLEDVILLPGAAVPDHTHISRAILGPGYSVPLSAPHQANPADLDGATRLLRAEPGADSTVRSLSGIGQGGSTRRYFRVEQADGSRVFMKTEPSDPDYDRQLWLSRFFVGQGLAVPRLIVNDAADRSALFEDLGDRSLYVWMKCPRMPEEVVAMYVRVVDQMAQLHRIPVGPVLTAEPDFRVFDYDHLRWETDYFLKEFAGRLLGVAPAHPDRLQDEFDRLARRVDAYPKVLVHRDFQSQNVMIHDGRPFLIDYQGCRIGPPAYDLASLLWDPYVSLDGETRGVLLAGYLDGWPEAMRETISDSLLSCRLQRHMQALGAYAFLSTVRGRTYFRKHVPSALAMLAGEVNQAGDYPELVRLIFLSNLRTAQG